MQFILRLMHLQWRNRLEEFPYFALHLFIHPRRFINISIVALCMCWFIATIIWILIRNLRMYQLSISEQNASYYKICRIGVAPLVSIIFTLTQFYSVYPKQPIKVIHGSRWPIRGKKIAPISPGVGEQRFHEYWKLFEYLKYMNNEH